MSVKADPSEFAGKRVLVSGGTKGAGRATVDRFLAFPVDGWELVTVLPGPGGAEQLVAYLKRPA